MIWLSPLRYRLRTAFRRDALEQQLDDELRFHLEMQTDANIRMGMTPAVAAARARQVFGSVEQHKDDYRDRWGARRVETLAQDLRNGLRQALSHWRTSLAVVVAMALGIGANTAIFSVFNSVVLHPLPFSEADRLVRLQAWTPPEAGERLFSAPEIRDLRSQSSTLNAVAEFHYMWFILLDRNEPQRVSAGVVSANFFDVIGVTPIAGRGFTADEERLDAPGVIVLSHRFWHDTLGADPDVVGRQFEMNDRTHTVVGVLPALPGFPEEADIYLPTSACPFRSSPEGDRNRSLPLVSALARVSSPAVGIERVRGDLTAVARQLSDRFSEEYPAPAGLSLSAVPVHKDLTDGFRPTLAVLVVSGAFLLLILCSSIGALMLAATLRRRREIALRSALGAWKGRLIRQFATEVSVLTLAGSAAGLVLAYKALPVLIALASRFTSRASEIQIDRTALLFTLGLAVVTAVVFGALVTLVAPLERRDDVLGLERSTRAGWPVFRGLVVLQIAVSFALLVGAGLMLQSVLNLQRIDTGYQARNVLTMRLSTDVFKYDTFERRIELFDRLLHVVQALPDVEAAAVSGTLPLTANDPRRRDGLDLRDRPSRSAGERPVVSLQSVSPEYFTTVGLALLEGRAFTASDDADGMPVAIVNRTMARHFWGSGSPLGREIRVGNGEWLRIVGVVSDARQQLNEAPRDEVFRPLPQLPLVHGVPAVVEPRLIVRSIVPPAVLEERIRTAGRRIDAQLPMDSFQTLDSTRDQSVAPSRLTALLIALFAGIGLVISMVGVGGVVGASVNARTREFGLRMALGARRRRLLLAILGDGLAMGAGGLALGCGFAALLSRGIGALLFGVAPYDWPTFAIVAALLLTVTIGACIVPARRAATVDPNVALRAV